MLTLAPRSSARGVTLIEAMITVTILAIVLMLGMPAVGDWIKNSQIRTAAEALQNGLAKARNEAVRRNTPVELVLGTGSAWTIQLAFASPKTVLESRQSGEGSSQVELTPFPAGTDTVTFDGMGRRWGDTATGQNADGSNPMTRICVDLPSTILPASRSRNLQVDIGLSGEVRMCDPEVSDSTDSRYCPGYPAIDCRD